MLHERYAPLDASDIVWSAQKANALVRLVDGMQRGAISPKVLLLHGPPGCGKLATVKALFDSDSHRRRSANALPPPASREPLAGSAAGKGPARRIRRVTSAKGGIVATDPGCQPRDERDSLATVPPASTWSSCGRLTLSLQRPHGDRVGPENWSHQDHPRSIDPPAVAAPARGAGPRASHVAVLERAPCSVLVRHSTDDNVEELLQFLMETFFAPSEPCTGEDMASGTCIRVVKTYGDTSSSAGWGAAFARLVAVFHAYAQTERLRHNFIVIVHTSHDVHSEKLGLRRAFPDTFLNSPHVHQFHCPAITELSLQRRLRAVLGLEGRRLQKRMEPTGEEDELRNICEQSNGDIRQALLQLQWATLLCDAHKAHDAEGRMEDPAALIPGTAGKRKRPRASASPATDPPRPGAPQRRLLRPLRTILDIVELSDGEDAAQYRDGEDGDTESGRCGSSSSLTAGPSRPSVSVGSGDVIDVDSLVVPARPTASPPEADGARGAIENLIGSIRSTKERPPPSLSDMYLNVSHASARILSQKYSVETVLPLVNASPAKLMSYLVNSLPYYFRRDQIAEYADCAAASSAADRILCTSSALYEGWQSGSVPDGGWNASRNASIVDSLARAQTGADGASPMPSGTLPLDVVGVFLFGLSYVVHQRHVVVQRSFLAHHPPPFFRAAYPQIHEAPCAPRLGPGYRLNAPSSASFAMHPLAANSYFHVRVEEPRVGQIVAELPQEHWERNAMERLKQLDRSLAPAEDGGAAKPPRGMTCGSEALHRYHFLRTGTPGVSDVIQPLPLEAMDILREGLPPEWYKCGSSDAVVLDYAPLASWIVLERRNGLHDAVTPLPGSDSSMTHPVASRGGGSGVCATSAASLTYSSSPTAVGCGPRKTIFSLSAPVPATRSREMLRSRPVSPLQWAILRCGLPKSLLIRSGVFHVEADGDNQMEGPPSPSCCGSQWIPEGEDISDFSE